MVNVESSVLNVIAAADAIRSAVDALNDAIYKGAFVGVSVKIDVVDSLSVNLGQYPIVYSNTTIKV